MPAKRSATSTKSSKSRKTGKTPRTRSPVAKLFEMLWGSEGTRSWRDLNDSLQDTLKLAIVARLQFAPGDFAFLYEKYNGHYWLGDQKSAEHWYGLACEKTNISACKSFEAWVGREPIILKGGRLFVGSELTWEGKKVTVTSFGEDHRGPYVVCCSYVWEDHTKKVDKRFKPSAKELRAGQKDKETPKPDREVTEFMKARGYTCSSAKEYFKKHLTLKSAWEAGDNGSEMLKLLKWAKFPIFTHEEDGLWASPSLIRARVGDFETNLLPLIRDTLREVRLAKSVEALAREDGGDGDDD